MFRGLVKGHKATGKKREQFFFRSSGKGAERTEGEG